MVLWTVPFVKPHLAIPLIPLAWYLGGWKPAAVLVALVGLLNAVGATMVGGSPLFLRDYLNYLPTAREVVAYNRVEMNPQITSWNRLLYAWDGPLVELARGDDRRGVSGVVRVGGGTVGDHEREAVGGVGRGCGRGGCGGLRAGAGLRVALPAGGGAVDVRALRVGVSPARLVRGVAAGGAS